MARTFMITIAYTNGSRPGIIHRQYVPTICRHIAHVVKQQETPSESLTTCSTCLAATNCIIIKPSWSLRLQAHAAIGSPGVQICAASRMVTQREEWALTAAMYSG